MSTPPGRGRCGIVRLSGGAALAVAARVLADAPAEWLLGAPGFSAFTGVLRDLPLEARVYVFRAPRSYTREDLVELHLPAAFPVCLMVCKAAERAGARPALPGEFTRRAFLNGRIGLEAAEGVLRAVSALSRHELHTAHDMRHGRASASLRGAAGELRDLAAELLATLDFPEEDVTFIEPAAAAGRLRDLAARLAATPAAEAAQAGCVRAVLLGRVNTGKTTLLNALAGSMRIVDTAPGTTRDVLEEEVVIGGHRLLLQDTPGVGENGPLAELAAAASLAAARRAELLVFCVRADAPAPPLEFSDVLAAGSAEGAGVVVTFSDLAAPAAAAAAMREWLAGAPLLFNCHTGLEAGKLAGVAALVDNIERVLSAGAVHATPEAPFSLAVVSERAASLLREAAAAIEQRAPEVGYALAEEALALLEGAIGGRPLEVDEAILDNIFQRFCVGK